MKIGVDFDNTIVCYDELFHRLARAKKLIPKDIPPAKGRIRDYLRECGKEDAWTQLQCEAYGKRIREAYAFPGVKEFFSFCKQQCYSVFIISHRTLFPVNGGGDNLHTFARIWLEHHGFYNSSISLSKENVYFEVTQEEKLRRIAQIGCDIFIDDLPEFLSHPDFPPHVKRFLFDPHDAVTQNGEFEKLASWKDYHRIVSALSAKEDVHSNDILESVSGFIEEAGFGKKFKLSPCPGGANNKVFRVDAKNSTVLLKCYFQHAQDKRDRLGAEFNFLSFAWKNGIRCVPRPLACDKKKNMALYEFIHGKTFEHATLTERHIDFAVDFYHRLNEQKHQQEALSLPVASEGFFTLEGHINCVEARLKKLHSIDLHSNADHEAFQFVTHHLLPAWNSTVNKLQKQASKWNHPLNEPVPFIDRCLSPSDFGFHNALLTDDGEIFFIDFEYAGWDDPAKTICDFFYQKKVPVPLCFTSRFVDGILNTIKHKEHFQNRVSLLFPVYAMKWCCILLNEFVSVGSERRRFASGNEMNEIRKLQQLEKARKNLQDFIDSKELRKQEFVYAL